MAKTKFIYNEVTCQYEAAPLKKGQIALNFLGLLSLSLALAVVMIYYYQQNFTTLKQSRLQKENKELVGEFQLIGDQLEDAKKELEQMKKKDDHVYRTLLAISPVPATIRAAGVGGSNKFEEQENASLERRSLILSTLQYLEKLKGEIAVQSGSYNELIEVLDEKKAMWASRPAITPLKTEDITKIGSGFRWRTHPIFRTTKFHSGLDITANQGKNIYASGDGVVTKAYYSKSYGNVVYIDHGYGYETRYAHMTAFNIAEGAHVKRGDIIGFVGSTGWSTAAHLHYEVLFRGEHIDPVPYLSKNLSSEEYQLLIDDSNTSDLILDY